MLALKNKYIFRLWAMTTYLVTEFGVNQYDIIKHICQMQWSDIILYAGHKSTIIVIDNNIYLAGNGKSKFESCERNSPDVDILCQLNKNYQPIKTIRPDNWDITHFFNWGKQFLIFLDDKNKLYAVGK